MTILYYGKIERLHSAEEHSRLYSSDSGIPGTYMPNMSDADKNKWKASVHGTIKPPVRVKIRKTMNGTSMLIVVHPGEELPTGWKGSVPIDITISANGKISMSFDDLADLNMAIDEARQKIIELSEGE